MPGPCWTHHGYQINAGLTETAVTGHDWAPAKAQVGQSALEAGEMQRREQIGIPGILGLYGSVKSEELNPIQSGDRSESSACSVHPSVYLNPAQLDLVDLLSKERS